MGLDQRRSAIVKTGEYDGTDSASTAGGSVADAIGTYIHLTDRLTVGRREERAAA
jgi:hypothetical protein